MDNESVGEANVEQHEDSVVEPEIKLLAPPVYPATVVNTEPVTMGDTFRCTRKFDVPFDAVLKEFTPKSYVEDEEVSDPDEIAYLKSICAPMVQMPATKEVQ